MHDLLFHIALLLIGIATGNLLPRIGERLRRRSHAKSIASSIDARATWKNSHLFRVRMDEWDVALSIVLFSTAAVLVFLSSTGR